MKTTETTQSESIGPKPTETVVCNCCNCTEARITKYLKANTNATQKVIEAIELLTIEIAKLVEKSNA